MLSNVYHYCTKVDSCACWLLITAIKTLQWRSKVNVCELPEHFTWRFFQYNMLDPLEIAQWGFWSSAAGYESDSVAKRCIIFYKTSPPMGLPRSCHSHQLSAWQPDHDKSSKARKCYCKLKMMKIARGLFKCDLTWHVNKMLYFSVADWTVGKD